jgi:hypothetical protein
MFETATVLTMQNDNPVVAGRDHVQTLALLRHSPLNMTTTTVVPDETKSVPMGRKSPTSEEIQM